MESVIDVPELFGSMVFNDAAMKAKLPKDVYMKLKDTIDAGVALDPTVADVVANAMMDWALEKGATHFTHWFQPMTGITAEKHDSFITPASGALPLKPEAILHGPLPPMHLLRIILYIFRRCSAPSAVKCWTKKHRCCVLWNC